MEEKKDESRKNDEVNAVDDNHVSTPLSEEKKVVARPANYGEYFHGVYIPELVAEWKTRLDLSHPNHSYTEDEIERAIRYEIGLRNYKPPPIPWYHMNRDNGYSKPLNFVHNPVELPWDDEEAEEVSLPADRVEKEARESEDTDEEDWENPYKFEKYDLSFWIF